MAFNYSIVSPGDDILAAHSNNLFDDIKAAHHQETGGTLLVNADLDAAAAIAYSKLNLTGSIVNNDINAAAAIAWSKISKTGSNITDLDTYLHNSLQTLQGGTSGQYYHLTSTQHTNLTTYDAELAAFFAATDITGAEAEELTDGSETTLHSHAISGVVVGGGQRTTVEGSGDEDVSLSFNPSLVILLAECPSYDCTSVGFSDGTNNYALSVYATATGQEINSSNSIYLRDGGSVLRWNATASFPGSNILRLAFTVNSAANNCNYAYLALR